MARKSPAFSFYPDSWVLGTMAMSYEEQGVYLRMLCFQWANGPADANAYANACGDAYVSHVNRILERKFTCIDGLYRNDRLEAERAKQSERSESAKTAAKSRWVKNSNENGYANAMRTHMQNGCERNANAYANAMPSVSDSVSVSNTKTKTEEGAKALAANAAPPASKVIDDWNLSRGQKVQLTDSRKKTLNSRLKNQNWADKYKSALERIKDSRFCNGENDRGWVADIDWFIRGDTIIKILEGKYDNRNGKTHKQPAGSGIDGYARTSEEFNRR